MNIRRLDIDDLDAAFELSKQAGWNQLRPDWRRLLELYPEWCFGGTVDGELVATTTVATYDGAVGWIGMVLVDEAHRRRGYGRAIVDHALAETLDRGVSVVGLDATDLGQPLYRELGFADAAPIARWCGELDVDVSLTGVGDLEPGRTAVHDLDRRVCGVDRSDLLDCLLAETGSVGVVRETDGIVRGYAVLRQGREHWQLGPVVADRREDAEHLLGAAAARLETDTVIVDAVRTDDTDDLLSTAGLNVQRELARMYHEREELALWGDAVWAAAGFELG